MTNEQRFCGVWLLEWQKVVETDGSESYPRGEQATGQLIYTPQQRMSVHLLRHDDRESQAFDFTSEATALNDTLAYAGRYTINSEQQTVIHYVEVCSYPVWVGRTLRRHYTFDSVDSVDFLTLRADYHQTQRILRWKRFA